ncbi:MAG: carboxypeptidase regulatory-like domain-containing protein, partial [Caldilinea sp.]|nr:carboxypeptidase regulatory-like domain-containing protein [Caldilinea sp.]
RWQIERTLATDAQGRYRAAVLLAGTYRVGYRDLAGVYGTAFYPDAPALEGAADVVVAGVDIVGVDAVLRPAGAVTGAYSDTQLSYIYTEIAALVPGGSGRWHEAVSVVVTTTGPYTLAGLQPGVYRICAYKRWRSGAYPELAVCYDNIISSVDYATPVTVTGGVTTTGIDLPAGAEGDGAVIAGVVRAAGGAPLAGMRVWLDRWYGPNAAFTAITTTTDAAGHYEVRGVVPGEYDVAFSDAATGVYVTQYYTGALTRRQATVVTVARLEERRDVDAVLALGGVLSGAVSILGQKPDTAFVQAERLDDTATSTMRDLTYDRSTGAYRLTGLLPGRYRIYVHALLDEVSSEGYYGGATCDDATQITVGAGDVITGLDVNLESAAYNGEVAGTVTAAGKPLAGIKVSLHSFGFIDGMVSAVTDAQGHYKIGGLTRGSYFAGFSDPTGAYATEYYRDALSLADATDVVLYPAWQLANIDADLATGGAASGRLVLDGGAPAADRTVTFWYVQADRPGDNLVRLTEQVVTDADGNYRIQGLRPGAYRVCATRDSYLSPSSRGCYGGFLQEADPAFAQDVRVQAGAETTDVDIFLGWSLPERAYLPVVAQQ